MKNLKNFEEFLNENSNNNIKKGDMVLYSYHRTTNHPLGGKTLAIALQVKDITRSGRFVEVFLDGRFQEISINLVQKTEGDFTDGQEISSVADYDFSKGELNFLKNK